jgi:3'(2'), 5'-bisphosphate nucleotidase
MDTLLRIAVSAAREAGEAIMDLYETTAFETKKDGSPVTIADHKANEILLARLGTTGIPILTEESDGIVLPYPSRLWVIDPIDGTGGFIQKTGDFSVMIGLIEDGRPILGVVYAAAHDMLYYAHQGAGAFKEHAGGTTRLMLSETPASPLRFICSRNHYSPLMQEIAEKVGAVGIPYGGIGNKAGMLVDGDGDFFFTGAALGEWDVCAPSVIMEEAGGIVSDCAGDPLFYGTKNHLLERGAIFSHPACHASVVDAIKNTYPTL